MATSIHMDGVQKIRKKPKREVVVRVQHSHVSEICFSHSQATWSPLWVSRQSSHLKISLKYSVSLYLLGYFENFYSDSLETLCLFINYTIAGTSFRLPIRDARSHTQITVSSFYRTRVFFFYFGCLLPFFPAIHWLKLFSNRKKSEPLIQIWIGLSNKMLDTGYGCCLFELNNKMSFSVTVNN